MKAALLSLCGIAGGLAASSCCLLPLVLVSAGLSGAWLGHLTALAAWQPLFLVIAAACLAAGFWLVYRPAGRSCALPAGPRGGLGRVLRATVATKAALWIGVALVTLSAGVDYGARLFL